MPARRQLRRAPAVDVRRVQTLVDRGAPAQRTVQLRRLLLAFEISRRSEPAFEAMVVAAGQIEDNHAVINYSVYAQDKECYNKPQQAAIHDNHYIRRVTHSRRWRELRLVEFCCAIVPKKCLGKRWERKRKRSRRKEGSLSSWHPDGIISRLLVVTRSTFCRLPFCLPARSHDTPHRRERKRTKDLKENKRVKNKRNKEQKGQAFTL